MNEGMTKDEPRRISISGTLRHSKFDMPATPPDIRYLSFLDTLLIASTNIGSLVCDGFGDAVLVQGEDAPGQALRSELQHFPGCRVADFQNRFRSSRSAERFDP
jgi:hypothetical protein